MFSWKQKFQKSRWNGKFKREWNSRKLGQGKKDQRNKGLNMQKGGEMVRDGSDQRHSELEGRKRQTRRWEWESKFSSHKEPLGF